MNALIWTFQLVGGEAFSIHVVRNPPQEHDGGISIWHLRLNEVQAQEIEALAKGFGARVTSHCETETDEQTEMHKRLFESEESLFQCAECPKCYWLDLQIEGYCGAKSWPVERRRAALETFEDARSALDACPVREGS